MTDSPTFTEEDDFVTRARADTFFQSAPGSLVETPDGELWTIVYNNLDGYGVVAGDRPEFIGAKDEDLPEPEAMLRDPYPSLKYRALGELIRVRRRIKPDGMVVFYDVDGARP